MTTAPDRAIAPEGPHGPIGVLVCGHGSRNRLAVEEFAPWPAACAGACPICPWSTAIWNSPGRSCVRASSPAPAGGAARVLAVPAMLFAAGHAKNDIPSVLNTYAAETGLRIDYGRELGWTSR
jgi:sirohydrochlorin cobaltochelatase